MSHAKEVVVIVKDEHTRIIEQRKAEEEGLNNWLFVNVNRIVLDGVRAKRIYVQPGVQIDMDTVNRELRHVYLPGYS
jgi:hypothetical protein